MSRQTDLRAFAEYWLRRPLTPADVVAVPSAAKLPAALREIYETFGGCAALTQPHNSLLLPSDMEIADGYSIFYAENQYLEYWSFKTEEAGADDPMVYQSIDSNQVFFGPRRKCSSPSGSRR
ncbi:hypothetical protein CfE428DRAFT_3774 [Chthoniobacter flavus Ellin428]|uniref:Knr4/Smi1-like domain-containing protein n=1 Tax=Chthoniobacter flavus Ellin428 TaxID=497964 RepID=B4D4D6_9BACT|nr:hypothetical protein [Chthoniobacter flavus]EDY18737.1 hypothetical protein CfE428DRAFT_3774 [Chthoniobacter flavus Ellin428]TCO89023.1 hypothetical protein EV701_11557 [Chthoniobacter flavus]